MPKLVALKNGPYFIPQEFKTGDIVNGVADKHGTYIAEVLIGNRYKNVRYGPGVFREFQGEGDDHE